MTDLAQLKEQAKSGLLDQAVRSDLADKVRARTSPLYELTDIVGWAGVGGPLQVEVSAMESLLSYRQDSMVPGLALTILVVRWGFARRYADVIRDFLYGPSWDLEGSAQLAGATSAGILLEESLDAGIVQSLLSIVRDANQLSGTRAAAYAALARGKGIGVREQLALALSCPAPNVQDDEVIEWASTAAAKHSMPNG